MTQQSIPETKRNAKWLRRMGVGGFLFFLIKGILWLTVPTMVVFFSSAC